MKSANRKSGLVCMALFSMLLLLVALSLLLYTLHHLLMFHRKLQTWKSSKTPIASLRPALVTMSDPRYQYCVLSLLTNARKLNWHHPIFLLTVNFSAFDSNVIHKLELLGVFFIKTNPVFDTWLTSQVENRYLYRALDQEKFRKMELFLNPILRSFERLIYVDADGVLASRLDPFTTVEFPPGTVLLMRQNDGSVGKDTLWGNEIGEDALTEAQLRRLTARFPDRSLTGASCWFVVNVRRLPSPEKIFEKSVDILCSFRAAFKLNDQTLLNLLFYEGIQLFPWCVWDEVPVTGESERLKRFCRRHMHLQRWIKGDLAFVYRHMSVEERGRCVARVHGSVADGRNERSANGKIEVVGQDFFDSILKGNASCLERFSEWKKMTMVPIGPH